MRITMHWCDQHHVDASDYSDWLYTPITFGGYGLRDEMLKQFLRMKGNSVALLPSIIRYENKICDTQFDHNVLSQIDPSDLSKDILDTVLVDSLDYADRNVKVVRRSALKQISVSIKPRHHKYTEVIVCNTNARYKNLPIHPKLAEAAKLSYIKDHNWEKLANELLEPSSIVDLYTMINRNVSRNLIAMWCLGKLETPTSKSIYYDPSISYVNDTSESIRRVLSMRNANYGDFLAMSIYAEIHSYAVCSKHLDTFAYKLLM